MDCERIILKIIYILIFTFGFCIFIFSIIQMSKGNGFKKILSLIENFVINFEESNEYCDKYISDIKSSKGLIKSKTIVNLLFNLYRVIYTFLRLKNLDKPCILGIIFFIILASEHIIVLSITSAVVNKYDFKDYNYFDYCFTTSEKNIIIEDESFKEEENNSIYMRKLDIGIISLNAISCWIMIFLGWILLRHDLGAYHCFEEDYLFDWTSIGDCVGNSDLRYNFNRLTRENDNLRNNLKNLKDEIKVLKRQKDLEENHFNSERIKLKDEILVINKKNYKNFQNEKTFSEEIDNLKESNDNLEKEIEELKHSKQMMIKDLEKIKNKLMHENLKIKQLNVIQFYTNKKIMSRDYNKDNYIQNIFLKELKEIKNDYGLNIDSDKFKEISLYYIKSKLIENLTDLKTKNIFSNPVITQDGKSYEKENINKSSKYIENKLVLEICKILKKSGDKLSFENFEKIKKLLISKETGNFYENPIVIVSGKNKGETIEDNGKIFGYKNEVIKNIIEDIRELLDDDFFKFEAVETEELISNNTNNINNNDLNISEFEEV